MFHQHQGLCPTFGKRIIRVCLKMGRGRGCRSKFDGNKSVYFRIGIFKTERRFGIDYGFIPYSEGIRKHSTSNPCEGYRRAHDYYGNIITCTLIVSELNKKKKEKKSKTDDLITLKASRKTSAMYTR